MSPQEQHGLRFTIATDQQAFKLIELPPSLMELLSSTNPPPLTIKSRDASNAAIGTSAKPAHVVLCTQGETFQLRQVQTSNSVFVACPSLFRDQNDALPKSCISAIAVCNHTLELHPAGGSPAALFRDLLPEYRDSDDVSLPNSRARSKTDFFSDAPFSDSECETAWRELCAFETGGRSWQPSPSAICTIWQSIVMASLAEGMNLESFSLNDLRKVLMEEGARIELFDAILLHAAGNGDGNSGETHSLNKSICIPWMGRTILLSQTEQREEVPFKDFMTAWQDALPEAWRAEAQIELIKDICTRPTATTIACNSHASASDASGRTSSKARKWHERFKGTRR